MELKQAMVLNLLMEVSLSQVITLSLNQKTVMDNNQPKIMVATTSRATVSNI